MVYESFLMTVVSCLQQEFGEGYEISVRKIPKNNGVTLDGLCIHRPDFAMSPTIYMNSYYIHYQNGMTMEAIIMDILDLYYNTSLPENITQANLADFDYLKPRIMFKLIHAASNKELLSKIPHIPYLDLAIIFYIHLDRSDSGQMTALICHEHLVRWNIKQKDLWHFALMNTPYYFPGEIRSMNELMEEIARKNLGAEYDEETLASILEDEEQISPLYVLSNQFGLNGAGCMLYRNILKDFAELIGTDLIILPSSIHEVLITPNHPGVSYEELSNMVTAINRTEVPPEDQLSNQVYLYTRADDRIRIVSHAPELVGAAAAH